MRSSGVVLALLLLGVLPGAAHGATSWDPPIALPVTHTATYPGPIVADGTGNVIAVSTAGGSYGDPFAVRIDPIVHGAVGSPAILHGWQLLDSAPDHGGLLLLLHRGLDPASDAGRLGLVKIAFGATRPSVRPRWSAPAQPVAAVTSTAAGPRVVWLARDGRAEQTTIGRDWRGARTRPLPVPRADATRGVSTAMDLAPDGHGGSILALTTVRDSIAHRGGVLVLADATTGGSFAVRQRIAGISGAPDLVPGPTGRVGLLLNDDGGITGGDCEGRGYPRRLWAGVRDAGSRRFHTPRLLLTSDRVCYQPGVHLTAATDGRFAVAWGVGYMLDSEPSALWLSTATATGTFSRPVAISHNLLFIGTAYDDAGTLSIAASRGAAEGSSTYVLQRRPADGPPGSMEPLRSADDAALATSDLSAHPVVWSRGQRLGFRLGHI